MTSSTITPTACNGGPPRPKYRLAALRAAESKGLISLALDALSETSDVGHTLHQAIYGQEAEATDAHLEQLLCEALACLETADHYLRMLGSVLDEHCADHCQPPAGESEPPR